MSEFTRVGQKVTEQSTRTMTLQAKVNRVVEQIFNVLLAIVLQKTRVQHGKGIFLQCGLIVLYLLQM